MQYFWNTVNLRKYCLVMADKTIEVLKIIPPPFTQVICAIPNIVQKIC